MDTSKFAGVPVLLNRLGLVEAIKIAWRIEREAARGEPWNALPEAVDQKEALSREQIAPAVLLYRALSETHDQQEALDIVRETAIAGGVSFLKKTIGIIDRNSLATKSEDEVNAWVEETAVKFFNADITFDTVSSERVAFTVSRCRFPELCKQVGVPELAPVFCASDEAFFGGAQPGVTLTRPETLARGGSCCPFDLTWDDGQTTG